MQEFLADHEAASTTTCRGTSIRWTNDDADNGAYVETVLAMVVDRLEFENDVEEGMDEIIADLKEIHEDLVKFKDRQDSPADPTGQVTDTSDTSTTTATEPVNQTPPTDPNVQETGLNPDGTSDISAGVTTTGAAVTDETIGQNTPA